MDFEIYKVPLDIAVRDIEKFVNDDVSSVNVGVMQARIYYEVGKLLKEVIEVVSAGDRDIELQKFDIPIMWITTVLKEIGRDDVTLQDLFPSEWLSVVAGLVHHELYVEHTGVTTKFEKRKIVYGIVSEMSGTADVTMYEVKAKWLGYEAEWETNREDVLKVVGVLSGPDTAPDTPGAIESITETCEIVGLALGIPTFVDMRDLREELGYSATPEEILAAYNANRDKYSKYVTNSDKDPVYLDPTTETKPTSNTNEDASPKVSNTTEDTPAVTPIELSEQLSAVEDTTILNDMLKDTEKKYRDAVRENIEITNAAAEQIKNTNLNTSDIEAKIDRLNITTPKYYGGGGGASSDWTTTEIVLGVAAVGAIGVALWYGYNRLTAEEYDINLSDFKIPDFDIEIPDFDFDSGFDFDF